MTWLHFSVVLTVAELAAYLGITPSAVRQAIRRHSVQPQGQRWRAKLYDAREVLEITGRHDRRALVAKTATSASH